MRRITISFLLKPLYCMNQQYQLQQQYRLKTEITTKLPGLVDHCKLVEKIINSEEIDHIRRKRIRGVVKKIELNYMNWLEECGPKECLLLLNSISKASKYLKRNHSTISEMQQDDEWNGVSPYFPPNVSDWLCASLQRAVNYVSTPTEFITLLSAAAELELSDTQSLQKLCYQLTRREYTVNASPEELVHILRLISLLVKRCRMPIPPLDNLLCRLPSFTLNSRQSLIVLSSILRLRERHGMDIVRIVSRKATEHVSSYTPKDIIYALEAITLLNCCHETYIVAVLDRCTILHSVLVPKELGSICKYVAMLNGTRSNNDISLSCAKELRRLLPALLTRTEELLGQFSLRDARCILKCLEQHKVHHSIVFSRLTPLVSEF